MKPAQIDNGFQFTWKSWFQVHPETSYDEFLNDDFNSEIVCFKAFQKCFASYQWSLNQYFWPL